MPSSCQDLQCLGHVVSGFYLVKGKEKKQIESVYCNFDRPGSKKDEKRDENSPAESRLGFLDVKTAPVYFYVQRNKGYFKSFSILPWELNRLNIGNAMDLETGIFTVPTTGVYHFHFSGMSSLKNHFQIALRVNGVKVGYAISDSRITSDTDVDAEYHPASLHSTLKLIKGDKIDLWLHWGVLYDDKNHFSHFTGWLDEEELSLWITEFNC